MIYQVEVIKPKDGQEKTLDDGMRNIVIAKDNYDSKNILGSFEVKRRLFPAQRQVPLVVHQTVSMPNIDWD